MNSSVWAGIDAIRSALPRRVVTNAELAGDVGWTAAEILAKTGIAQRHVASADECVSDLAVRAAETLLAETGADRRTLDFVVLCTQTPDHLLPATACLVHHRLGLASRCAAFDLNQGCSGYVYALGVANAYLRSGMATRGLVLTGDTYTKLIHPRDRSVRTLFGDAATATLVSARATPGMDHFVFGTDGAGAKNLIVPAGGMREPHTGASPMEQTDASGNVRSARHLFMSGTHVFAFTLQRVPELLEAVLARSGLRLEEVDWFVFHQANRYLLDHLTQKLHLPPEKVILFLENTGNTVSSSIPLALEHAAGKFSPGDRILLAGFGVGYSWGAAILRWT
jgi:3-oxoacyl-[acyl-carrier-protein] synthase III